MKNKPFHLNTDLLLKQGILEQQAALDGNLSVYNEIYNPGLGDLVFEESYRSHGSDHIGFLLRMDYNKGFPTYWILNLKEKSVKKWVNCKFIKIRHKSLSDKSYQEYYSLLKEIKY